MPAKNMETQSCTTLYRPLFMSVAQFRETAIGNRFWENKTFSRMTTVEQRSARMEPSGEVVTKLIRTAWTNFLQPERSFLA